MQQKMQRAVERERLVNAAHRFAKISKDDPVKLFGLLYMLDVRHFLEEGRSCTGEVYYAMADGPAPGTLRPLLVMRELDIDVAIGILTATDTSGSWTFDPLQFCDRGLDIMIELEAGYAKANSRDLALDDANAWWQIYTQSRGVGAIIPYELTVATAPHGISPTKHTDRKTFARRFRVNTSSLIDYGELFKSANTPD